MKPKRKRWSEAEREKLYELAGDFPLKKLVRHYNRWAQSQGYPTRSTFAVRAYASSQKLSLRPRYNTMSLSGLADAMGIPMPSVYHWHQNGWLKTSQNIAHGQIYVTVDAFTEFAKNHPHRIRNVDPTTLRSMVGDEVADLVLNTPIRVKKWKVVDKQTGATYPSLVHASKALFYGSEKSIKSRPERFKLIPVY